jgi:hypothetical protein
MKLECSWHVCEKKPSVKFNENPFSRGWVVPCRRTDGQTHRQTDRRRDKQRNRQRGRQTDIHSGTSGRFSHFCESAWNTTLDGSMNSLRTCLFLTWLIFLTGPKSLFCMVMVERARRPWNLVSISEGDMISLLESVQIVSGALPATSSQDTGESSLESQADGGWTLQFSFCVRIRLLTLSDNSVPFSCSWHGVAK